MRCTTYIMRRQTGYGYAAKRYINTTAETPRRAAPDASLTFVPTMTKAVRVNIERGSETVRVKSQCSLQISCGTK